jgi:putative two-component system response regulator
MAIADVYDALRSQRCYKPPFDHEKSIAIMQKGRGTHFDPLAFDAFSRCEQRIIEISKQYTDEEESIEELGGIESSL